MLTITNGEITIEVTNGAFNNFYKHSGFRPLEHIYGGEEETVVSTHGLPSEQISAESTQQEMPISDAEENTAEPEAESSELEEEVDLSEIPIAEMDFKQLHAYAERLQLDHKDVHSKKELRNLIRNNIA